jgi:hypothetical protein
MSPEEMDRVNHAAVRAAEQAAQRAHEKSRLLSAEAVDAALPLADASWLNAHLRACPACRAVDDEYRAIHAELRSLPTPEPPRDLWARTSAGLDSVDRTAAQRSASPFGFLSARRTMVGSAAAAGLAIVVVGAVVLTGTLGSGGSSPAATGALAVASPAPSAAGQAEPLTVVDGTTYWVAPVNGLYQITGGSTRCTGTAANCAVTNGNGTLLGSIASTSSVSVVIAPGAKQAAVWTADKIVVLPLTATAPKTVSFVRFVRARCVGPRDYTCSVGRYHRGCDATRDSARFGCRPADRNPGRLQDRRPRPAVLAGWPMDRFLSPPVGSQVRLRRLHLAHRLG